MEGEVGGGTPSHRGRRGRSRGRAARPSPRPTCAALAEERGKKGCPFSFARLPVGPSLLTFPKIARRGLASPNV